MRQDRHIIFAQIKADTKVGLQLNTSSRPPLDFSKPEWFLTLATAPDCGLKHRCSQGTRRVMSPKFLACLVVLFSERRCPKQNTVACFKFNIFDSSKTFWTAVLLAGSPTVRFLKAARDFLFANRGLSKIRETVRYQGLMRFSKSGSRDRPPANKLAKTSTDADAPANVLHSSEFIQSGRRSSPLFSDGVRRSEQGHCCRIWGEIWHLSKSVILWTMTRWLRQKTSRMSSQRIS